MPVKPITTHVSDALARLAQQYVAQPNVTRLVSALCTRVQTAEDALTIVATDRALFGAKARGKQLDALGAIVGLPRGSLDDETYYVLILGNIAKNYSDATLDTLERIARTIFQARAVWVTSPNTFGHQRQDVAAEISLAVADPKTPLSLTPLLVQILQASLAGGVTLVSLVSYSGEAAFAMDGDQPWVAGPSKTDGTGGGVLATILYQNPNA